MDTDGSSIHILGDERFGARHLLLSGGHKVALGLLEAMFDGRVGETSQDKECFSRGFADYMVMRIAFQSCAWVK